MIDRYNYNCVCIYICIYVCVYLYIFIYLFIYWFIYLCMHAFVHSVIDRYYIYIHIHRCACSRYDILPVSSCQVPLGDKKVARQISASAAGRTRFWSRSRRAHRRALASGCESICHWATGEWRWKLYQTSCHIHWLFSITSWIMSQGHHPTSRVTINKSESRSWVWHSKFGLTGTGCSKGGVVVYVT